MVLLWWFTIKYHVLIILSTCNFKYLHLSTNKEFQEIQVKREAFSIPSPLVSDTFPLILNLKVKLIGLRLKRKKFGDDGSGVLLILLLGGSYDLFKLLILLGGFSGLG